MWFYALFVALFAAVNRLRGWSAVEDFERVYGTGVKIPVWRRWADRLGSRGICGVYAGLLTAGLVAYTGADRSEVAGVFFTAGVGFWLWALHGIGDYFDFSRRPNNEVAWIDDLLRDLRPGRNKDALCMALRGTHAAAFFIGVPFLAHGDYSVQALALAMIFGLAFTLLFAAGKGLIYRVFSRLRRYHYDDIPLSEVVVGAWMAGLVAFMLHIAV